MFKRVTRVFTILLVIASTLIVRAQEPRQVSEQKPVERKDFPEFDIRDTTAPAAALLGQRAAAISAFSATPEESVLRTRISVGRFGLPKVYQRDGNTLTSSTAESSRKPEETARDFLRSRSSVFLLSPSEVDDLRVIVEDVTDRAIFLAFNQTVNGIDVYNGQIKFTFNRRGEIIQVGTGDVVPGVRLSVNPSLTSEQAVRTALAAAGVTAPATVARIAESERKETFLNPAGSGTSPIMVEPAVFPMTALSARLAYRIFVEAGDDAFYEMLIDAETGNLLFRHNLYRSIGQANVWTESPMKGARTLVTFPSASTASPAGWISDNGTVTTGNNVDAYLDTDGNDTPDSTSVNGLQGGRASSGNQVFDFPFGDGTLLSNPRLFQAASVTNLFYLVNIAHDYYYNLGFTEAAGSYQSDNFGRGGLGGDPVLAESQQLGTSNNASFAPTPDGTPAKIRMGIFTRGTSSLTDDLDSSYDGQVVFHEYGHGVSTRLVGARTSVTCLNGTQSGAMGEGWSDYFSISYYNNPVEGYYLTQNPTIGVRRQSYEGYTFTYEDIGNAGYEVHSDGEIWAATLWDLRKSVGAAIADRLVIDGLKSTPCSPSMIDARDAIVAADLAGNAGVNRTALWTVFARHGMGYSAVGMDGTAKAGTRYDAAFDQPPDLQPVRAPAVTSNPFTQPSLNSNYQYTVIATNPAGGSLNYVLSAGPSGMTIGSSGNVDWIAAFTNPRVKITITDSRGGRLVHGFKLAVLTRLTDNLPVSISGARNSTGYASIQVPQNVDVLQVTLRDGTGDADLFLYTPAGVLSGSPRDGNSETVSISRPQSGEWQISVFGFLDYSTVTLRASFIVPSPLGLNATLTNLSGVISSEVYYRVTVPGGTNSLSISSTGSGNANLYLRKDAPAVCPILGTCVYDQRSANTGSTESISVTSPAGGEWYVTVAGGGAYSALRVDTSQYPPVSITTTSLPSGYLGQAYSQSIAATGGLGPYTWAVLSGTPPAGLILMSNGSIVGIPTAAGSSSFTIRARDSLSKEATTAFTLNIAGPPVVGLATGGTAALATVGTATDASVGYAVASMNNGTASFATAVFGLSQNGFIVSEVGIPASPPTASSRVFMEYRTGVPDGSGTIDINTGMALVNRNTTAVSVTYILRDRNGVTITTGHGDLPAGAHRARFLHELVSIAPDFNFPSNFSAATQYGTLDILSSQPISVLALRLTTNQRQETLLSSTPVADLSKTPSSSAAYFAQLAEGGGFKTSINLINNSNSTQVGSIELFNDAGSPLSVRLTNGASGSTIPYSVPAAGAAVFQTDGSPASVGVGWVRVVPNSGNTVPEGTVVFSNRLGANMVTESAVPSALPTTRARLYVDTSGGHNTGIAIANSSGASNTVTVKAFQADGTTPVGTPSNLTLDVNGHRGAFAGELIEGLPAGFIGVVELSSPSPFVALTLRSLINGRGDFLLTTFPLADANQTPSSPIVLPQIVNGGGFKTEFIFIGTGATTSAFTLNFYGDDGATLPFATTTTVGGGSSPSGGAFTPGNITTVAGGAGTSSNRGDAGPATSAYLGLPSGVAFDAAGNMYIADWLESRIRKVTPAGIITTFAGGVSEGFGGDGGSATSASLDWAMGVAVDSVGNVYIADTYNSRVRKVSPAGIITTIAGTGTPGYTGDGGPAASATLDHPRAIAVDSSGNVLIADSINAAIRKVSTSGIITTLVSGLSNLSLPNGVVADAAGNIYFTDTVGNRVRMLSSTGVITTIAGTGTSGFAGDGGPATSAQLSSPQGIARDSAGNVFISDNAGNRIRRVSSAGTITTIAGTGVAGFSGDGLPAAQAQVNSPRSLAFDASGNLYVAEQGNGRIRKIANTP